MSANEVILAVDIGTSATKAVLFDTNANQIAIVRKHYPILAPSKGWSEQEPDVIFNAVLEALREIVQLLPAEGRIQGIAFSSQLYSVLAVDIEGNPLTNSLTWSDTRSAQFARSIRQHPEAALLQIITCQLGNFRLIFDDQNRFVHISRYEACNNIHSSIVPVVPCLSRFRYCV